MGGGIGPVSNLEHRRKQYPKFEPRAFPRFGTPSLILGGKKRERNLCRAMDFFANIQPRFATFIKNASIPSHKAANRFSNELTASYSGEKSSQQIKCDTTKRMTEQKLS